MSRLSSVPIHRIYFDQAARSPSAVALDGVVGPRSYQQLLDHSQRIAQMLVQHGVIAGDTVAVAIDRNVNVVAGFLGILSAGASYCPLDLNQPAERIEFLLNDATPKLILASRAVADRVPDRASVVWVEDTEQLIQDSAERIDRLHPDGIACLLYTSGSTGTPKGVLIPQEGIIRLVIESDFIPFGPSLRMLFHSQLVFDASTLEIWGPLLNGGTCVLFPGRGVPTLHELRQAIRQHRVNTLYLGPAPYNLIIEESPDVLEGLNWLILGGEAMSPTHARRGLELFPKLHLVNGYGPTETTTFATSYHVPRDLPIDAKSVPIGKPIARTTAYIFDSAGNLITDGTPGELLVGGAGVARGYLNRPQFTAERFVKDPFSLDPNAKLYRTGDFCRWLPDGNLDYIERIDNQVKIRGQRIEPGEIETAMRLHPGVGLCIVISRGQAADKYLVAFYTTKRGQHCASAELREHLQCRLPAYLIPEKLIELESMPATRNGKVDRRALPPDDLPVPTKSSRQPSSPLEKELAELWKNSLRVQQVGLDDCFFELGGSSLGMMRLCSQIQSRTNQFISVATFISASTVGKMAAFLNDHEIVRATSLAVPLRPSTGEPLFCIAGHGGHPLVFHRFSQHLQWPGPVYGLQFPGLDDATAPAHSVEEMAGQFNEIVQTIAAGDRYHLLGYSFGGLVAFEMACLAETGGMNLGNLILLDAFTNAAAQYRNRYLQLARRLRNALPGKKKNKIHTLDSNSKNSAAAGAGVMPHAERINHLNRQAFKKYQPRQYNGDVFIVHPLERPDWREFYVADPEGGWSDFVPANRLHKLRTPGNHLSMVQELHAKSLAEIVDSCLGAAAMTLV